MRDKILSALLSEIREEKNNIEKDITSGGCLDYARYREAVGVLRGLTMAERDVAEFAQRLEEYDE